MKNTATEDNSLSGVKADEYRLSFKRVKAACRRLTISVILLFFVLSCSVIITKFARFFGLEIVVAVSNLVWILFLVKKVREEKRLFAFDNHQLDDAALLMLRLDFYHYYKQFTDIIYFIIPILAIAVNRIIVFFVYSGQLSGIVSFQLAIFYCLIFLALLYLLINTALKLYCGRPYLQEKQRRRMKKDLLLTTVACFSYWLIACIFLLSGLVEFHHTRLYCIVFLAVYLATGIIVNLFDKRQSFSSLSRATCIICAIGIIVLSGVFFMNMEQDCLGEYVSAVKGVEYEPDEITYSGQSGTFVITTEKEDFKILQLSDIHLGGSVVSKARDIEALEACRKLIADIKPDMVVVTGDMVFSLGLNTLSFNNYTPVVSFCDFMDKIGIPWAFTYGNHDTEFFSVASGAEIDALYQSASYINNGIMLYPDKKPDITGRCNQCIEIRNGDGSLRQAIFLMDSNAYTGLRSNTYDGIHADQVEWYEGRLRELTVREGKVPVSILYTHIPLNEMSVAYDLYREGSDEVEYLSGATLSERAASINADITTQPETCKMFDSIVKMGSTQTVFFGHNHFTTLNLKYKNIRLCYGLSIDYITQKKLVKNTYQRGGKVVTIFPDSSYEITEKLLTDLN